MSLNKVLNRPMFRREALRKGALKPIRARVGISVGRQGVMVGQPKTAAQVPAVVPGQGTYSRVNLERFGPPKPTRLQNLARNPFVRTMFNIPFAGGYYGGETVAKGLGIQNPLAQMPFGLAGGYAATKALPTLAAAPVGISAALMAGPAYLMYAGSKERERIANMTPKEREAHRQKSMQFGMSYLDDEQFNQQFGVVKPKPIEEKIVTKKSAAPETGPGSGRVGFGNRTKQLKAEGDTLLADNVTQGESDIANLDKVQENSIGMSSADMPPGPPGSSDADALTAKGGTLKKQEDAKPTPSEEKGFKGDENRQSQNEINVGGISEDPTFNQTIQLARKYYDEVYEGRGSQANLVFLANLASGLLSGTSRDRGIGGAMQILGQALGPAVNNYATIKLKEGELRQNAREASLNAAMDHMEFLNENAKTETEYPDRTGGVIQIRGADGKLRNYKGYSLKDGTIQIAAGKGEDGREQFVTVSQGSPIKDSEGNVIGRFEDFKEQKAISTRLTDLHDILGNRYDALATAREVLGIIGQEDAKAGAALSVDTFTRRLLGVGKELLGGSTMLDLDSEMANLENLYKDEIAALDRALAAGEITESEYERNKKALDIGEFEKGGLLDEARKRILENSGKKGFYSNLSREDQETLAVYETKLVYALANTFKDQDRLTQRDINAAKEIVNIFSLSRSSADVRASIQAIARGLESDIRRQEKLFTAAGGLESTLQELRSLKDFTPFESQSDLAGTLSKDLGIEEITKELEKLEL